LNLSLLAWLAGDYQVAENCLTESLPAHSSYENGERQAISRILFALVSVRRNQVGLVASDTAQTHQRARLSADLVREGARASSPSVQRLLLEVLGVCAAALDNVMGAARLWGAAEAMREAGTPAPADGVLEAPFAEIIATAKSSLLPVDTLAFAQAWTEGQALTWSQAVEVFLLNS
jgi:hypothetical protein